jgi:hypothetical protein
MGDFAWLGITLIEIVSGVDRYHFLPELTVLLTGGQTGADLANLRADPRIDTEHEVN